jgi:hypothetical protein
MIILAYGHDVTIMVQIKWLYENIWIVVNNRDSNIMKKHVCLQNKNK